VLDAAVASDTENHIHENRPLSINIGKIVACDNNNSYICDPWLHSLKKEICRGRGFSPTARESDGKIIGYDISKNFMTTSLCCGR
jgi:hypothetical protein